MHFAPFPRGLLRCCALLFAVVRRKYELHLIAACVIRVCAITGMLCVSVITRIPCVRWQVATTFTRSTLHSPRRHRLLQTYHAIRQHQVVGIKRGSCTITQQRRKKKEDSNAAKLQGISVTVNHHAVQVIAIRPSRLPTIKGTRRCYPTCQTADNRITLTGPLSNHYDLRSKPDHQASVH